MKKFENCANCLQNDDLGHLILRLTLGLLMLPHGMAKLSGIEGIMGMLSGVGLPGFIAYGVYAGEILAPLMIIFGFRTRIGAALVAFTMVMAIGLAHAKEIFTVGPYGGLALELQYFFLFVAIGLMFLGAGKYAVSQKSKWD